MYSGWECYIILLVIKTGYLNGRGGPYCYFYPLTLLVTINNIDMRIFFNKYKYENYRFLLTKKFVGMWNISFCRNKLIQKQTKRLYWTADKTDYQPNIYQPNRQARRIICRLFTLWLTWLISSFFTSTKLKWGEWGRMTSPVIGSGELLVTNTDRDTPSPNLKVREY